MQKTAATGRCNEVRKLEVTAAALVVLAVVGLPAAVFGYDSFLRRGFDGQVIDLTAAEGSWSRDVIRIKQGEKVRVRLTSNDVVHGFALKGYGLAVDGVYPGKVKVVEFVADRQGSFRFACTVICHVNHADMEGDLIVEKEGESSAQLTSER